MSGDRDYQFSPERVDQTKPEESRVSSGVESPSPPGDATPQPAYEQWANIVDRIRAGESGAMEELYRTFSRGIRYYLCRQLGTQELDDRVHDAFLIVVQAIRSGALREPERLMGYVRTVVRRQVAAHIDQVVQNRREHVEFELGARIADHRQSPEDLVLSDERVSLMEQFLEDVSPRDREILTRFYLRNQPQEQICAEMDLTETQFRLLKSRAKSRFGEIGRKHLSRTGLQAFSVRKRPAG